MEIIFKNTEQEYSDAFVVDINDEKIDYHVGISSLNEIDGKNTGYVIRLTRRFDAITLSQEEKQYFTGFCSSVKEREYNEVYIDGLYYPLGALRKVNYSFNMNRVLPNEVDKRAHVETLAIGS